MPWGRVDDSHYDHPKVMGMPVEVRNEALGLYWRAISYCNAKLTDGFIGDGVVALLDGSERLAAALVKAKLWHRKRGGFTVHDFLDGYNKSRAQVETERQQRVEAGRIGGLAKAASRTKSASGSARVAKPKQTASAGLANGKQKSAPSRPVPSRPVPLENGGSGGTGSSDAGAMPSVGAIAQAIVPSRAKTTTTTTDGEQR